MEELPELFDDSYQQKVIRHQDGILIIFSKEELKHFLLIDKTHSLGKGASASVYPAELTLANQESSILAAKVLKPESKINVTELKLNNLFYKTYAPIKLGDNFVILMEKIPGFTLVDQDYQLSAEIQQLSTPQRAAIIVSILNQIQMFHCAPKADQTFIHSDISECNILIDIDLEHFRLQANIIDFGLADIQQFNIDGKQKCRIAGTPFYIAPEILQKQKCTATDIFALTPIIARLLGAKDPLKYKKGTTALSSDFFKATYDFEGLLSDEKVPLQLPILVTKFLKKMCDPNTQKRPNIEICQRFFLSCFNVIALADSTNILDKQCLLKHMLIIQLLAQDLWYQPLINFPWHTRYFHQMKEAELLQTATELGETLLSSQLSASQIRQFYLMSQSNNLGLQIQLMLDWLIKKIASLLQSVNVFDQEELVQSSHHP